MQQLQRTGVGSPARRSGPIPLTCVPACYGIEMHSSGPNEANVTWLELAIDFLASTHVMLHQQGEEPSTITLALLSAHSAGGLRRDNFCS